MACLDGSLAVDDLERNEKVAETVLDDEDREISFTSSIFEDAPPQSKITLRQRNDPYDFSRCSVLIPPKSVRDDRVVGHNVDRKKLADMSPSERVVLRVHVQQQLRPFPEAFKEFSEKYIEGLSGLSSEEVETLQQILKDYSTRNFGTSVLKAANFGFGYLLPMQNFGASVLSAAQAGALRKLVKRFSKKYFEVDVPMLIAAESCSTAFLVTIPRSFQGLVHDTLGLLTVGPLMVEELESNENVDKIVPRHRRTKSR
jgi:uncharacterized protein YeaO (DUF488 family)